MDIAAVYPLLHTLVSFVVILSIIVFIHEFGHYIVARWCGVKVEEFAIGFGKELFGFYDKKGTRWKVCLIPMGGYVKMFGDASEASTPDAIALEDMSDDEKAVSFHYKSLPRKAAIVSAGPIANFILTIIIFTGFIFSYGMSTSEPIVGELMEGTPAYESGLMMGDRVIVVDGEEIDRFSDITRRVALSTGDEPIAVTVNREGEELTFEIMPEFSIDTDQLGNEVKRPLLGIRSQKLTIEDVGLVSALGEAVRQTYDITVMTLEYIGQLIVGDRGPEELKGPIGIAKLSGQAADQGVYMVLWFMAMLSANLGMVNLFPIPPLDGGHLLFYAVEGAQGRPMAEKIQDLGYRIGFALILALMAFTIYNDIKSFL